MVCVAAFVVVRCDEGQDGADGGWCSVVSTVHTCLTCPPPPQLDKEERERRRDQDRALREAVRERAKAERERQKEITKQQVDDIEVSVAVGCWPPGEQEGCSSSSWAVAPLPVLHLYNSLSVYFNHLFSRFPKP